MTPKARNVLRADDSVPAGRVCQVSYTPPPAGAQAHPGGLGRFPNTVKKRFPSPYNLSPGLLYVLRFLDLHEGAESRIIPWAAAKKFSPSCLTESWGTEGRGDRKAPPPGSAQQGALIANSWPGSQSQVSVSISIQFSVGVTVILDLSTSREL